jgi:putative intracellular protease/amidase
MGPYLHKEIFRVMRPHLALMLAALLALAACTPASAPATTPAPLGGETAWAPAEPPEETSERTNAVLFVVGNDFGYLVHTTMSLAFSEAGYEVVVASVSLDPVRAGDRDAAIEPDLPLEDVQTADYQAIILTCDMLSFFSQSEEAIRIVREAVAQDKPLGAFGCSSMLLAHAGVLEGVNVLEGDEANCSRLEEYGAVCTIASSAVQRDGMIITAIGDGQAGAFAEAVIGALRERNEAP